MYSISGNTKIDSQVLQNIQIGIHLIIDKQVSQDNALDRQVGIGIQLVFDIQNL